MLPLKHTVDITADMVDTVDTDTVDIVADIMARDPLMLNLSLMLLPITVDTMVLVDTTAVDTMVVTDMAVLDTTAVDTMDVKGGPLKVMPKPTMVDITDMVDTVDTMVVTDMAVLDTTAV